VNLHVAGATRETWCRVSFLTLIASRACDCSRCQPATESRHNTLCSKNNKIILISLTLQSTTSSTDSATRALKKGNFLKQEEITCSKEQINDNQPRRCQRRRQSARPLSMTDLANHSLRSPHLESLTPALHTTSALRRVYFRPWMRTTRCRYKPARRQQCHKVRVMSIPNL
jgi:hypothetical protein